MRTGIFFSLAALWLVAGDADSKESRSELGKMITQQLKFASIDAKSHRIEVKESGFEVVWDAVKTRFYRHRSVLLKDIPAGATLQVFGKRHEPRDDSKKAGGRTDPLVTDVEFIGTGDAFLKPALTAKAAGVAWDECSLAVKQPPSIEIGKKKTRYRLVGDDKLAAYSLEKLAPEKLAAGARVVIHGSARKVTVERNGKPVELTRVQATEVHWIELNADHATVFHSEWVERKKDPQPAEAGSKGAEKGK